METLCAVMMWTMLISGVIFAFSYMWTLLKLPDHMKEEQTKADDIIWFICFFSFLIALTSLIILTTTPLHKYGWYP